MATHVYSYCIFPLKTEETRSNKTSAKLIEHLKANVHLKSPRTDFYSCIIVIDFRLFSLVM